MHTTGSAASNTARTSNQSSTNRTRSTPRVAAAINQGERAPTTIRRRRMGTQVLGSQASTGTSAQPM
ncbi:hypothetical protein DEO72_LG10g2922 [Vigna unguiculata]|uniref:Uncharacterized protein n=1 Tax=Vigna unguiculata TaxID=3917 RepID=A0A4D6ND73_VIGUN|nr:hypothetical protein DEO72_LG10g2922 [Vigna unguiculata]